MVGYALSLDSELHKHFDLMEGLRSAFEVSIIGLYAWGKPIYWYLLVMWFDFFPWCTLIPSGVAVFFKTPAGNVPV